jgi:hypothetical protein
MLTKLHYQGHFLRLELVLVIRLGRIVARRRKGRGSYAAEAGGESAESSL